MPEAVLQEPYMCLGEVFVFAHEDNYGVPEFECLRFVLFKTISDYFRFAYVCLRVPGIWVCSEKEVDPCAFELFSG